jgi:adenylate cyclase, class 2
MKNRNIEIKARIDDFSKIRPVLSDECAVFIGHDHQCDTYFSVPSGRLKIREGTIENCIVWYERPDIPGPKQCSYHLIPFEGGDGKLSAMRELLEKSLGVTIQVVKEREIYFIGNVKIHLDTVAELGHFVEIEAIGRESLYGDNLRFQCDRLLKRFGICPEALMDCSYSDMLMKVITGEKTYYKRFRQ